MNFFTKKEESILRKLNTPSLVQTFINKIPINFEQKGETCMSPLSVLRENKAHCMEGAMLAWYIFSIHKKRSWLLHLKTTRNDFDHVVCVFKEKTGFGAISKTNHAVLRYRDPVYKNIRELVMSYFHEYTNDDGVKTLASYSDLLDMKVFDKSWTTAEKDLWYIDRSLDKLKHYSILNTVNRKFLRKVDDIEVQIGNITQWKNKKTNT